jgi:type I restriction enzyme S subunit
MSIPKYKVYKDSGVEWLGDVPSHWETARLRRLFEIKKRIVGTLGFDVLSITQQGLKIKDTESNEGQTSMDYSKYQLVEPGDFAMNHMDLLTGYVDVANIRGVTSPDYRVFSVRNPSQSFDRYYLYLLQACYHSKIFYAFGQGASQLGRWRLPAGQFKDFVFPRPPVQEQVQIAGFLDSETAKIDELIEEQRRLIELLKEKRHGVISHAVTKGLDPNAPMKNSDVQWLGEIPEHWTVTPLKLAMGFQEGPGILANDFVEEGVPLLRVAGVTGRFATLDGANYLDPKKVESRWSHFRLRKGDLILSASASLGAIAEVGDEVEGAVPYTGLIRLIARPNKITKDFIRFLMASRSIATQIELLATGATMQHFGPTHLCRMKIALPPIVDQLKILDQLTAQCDRINALEIEVQAAISLLQERRAVLISAAVTGKIDVRGLVPVKAEAA